MSAPAAPAVAQIPTVGLSVELPAGVARWDLAVLLADVLDLHAGEVGLDEDKDLAGDADVVTLSAPDLTRMLIVSGAPDAVRLRLLVTAPDAEARGVLADALEELAVWADDAGVDGWRWTADGCAGWHCGGSSCLTPAVAPAWRVARWRRIAGRVFAELGMPVAYAIPATVALYVVARWTGSVRPGAGVLSRWVYDLGDAARSVPVALAAYAAGRLLLVVAALLDQPREGRLVEVRDAAGPVVLAVVGALLGAGWLR